MHRTFQMFLVYACSHLGSRREASKNKLKTLFIFPMTNVTILSIFCTHAQKEYSKLLELKSTSILNILALILFEFNCAFTRSLV